jgi:hypothetical protein
MRALVLPVSADIYERRDGTFGVLPGKLPEFAMALRRANGLIGLTFFPPHAQFLIMWAQGKRSEPTSA